MNQIKIEKELDVLLSETLEAAELRAKTSSSVLNDERAPLILYGAGNLGRWILAKMRTLGIEPVAFADDTIEKQGKLVDGLIVLSPREVISQLGSKAIFVITILNPHLRFIEARRRLQETTRAHVISFLELAWKYPEAFLPYGQFELPQAVLAKATDVHAAFHLFDDEESRRQYAAHLRFRLRLDYEALPERSQDNYFPKEILLALSDDLVFVDCGAYDGDTLRHLMEHRHGRFRKIFAFEPDENNFQKLRAYVALLDTQISARISVYKTGVGAERSILRFNPTGDMSASFSSSGTAQVDVVPLDEILADEINPMYIKFDVEGAEWDALKGAEKLLRRLRPALAVSAYHRPDDLWQIPLYLKSLKLDYRFFLRTQGEDGMDVICYAVPPIRAS